MTSAPDHTSDTPTRARVAALFRPKKAQPTGYPSHLFAPKKEGAAQVPELVTPKKAVGNLTRPEIHRPPATLTCPRCGHSITLEVAGTAYCRPCKQAMRPAGEGGKREKRAQHGKTPHKPRPKEGSNRPIMHLIGGHAWHARP